MTYFLYLDVQPIVCSNTGFATKTKEVLEFMNLFVESYNPIQELSIYEDEQL